MKNLFLTAQIPIANVLFAMRESNLPGQVIVLILLGWSVVVWTIMISKGRELSRAKRETQNFISQFRRENNPIAIFLKNRVFRNTPVYTVYEKGCIAIGGELNDRENPDPEELLLNAPAYDDYELTTRQCELVRNNVERTVTDEAMMLEDKMGALAIAVTTCPFLGLLGTVWGVMDAFGGMAVTGSATLSAVAPGIAGALLTTIVGLLVAIPSAIGYNMLTHRIRTLHVQMDNFAQEFMSAVQRHYLAD
jgi:biopolymer transport protein ExbB/TolQ